MSSRPKGDGEPVVSVVVCAYNEEKRLRACIESLISQDLDLPYEIIVVDDGSSDTTPDIAETLARKSVHNATSPPVRYYRIEHAGLSIARNTGVSVARGEVIAFIDADGRATPQWLRKLLVPFSDRKVDVVAGRILNLNDEVEFARFIYKVHFETSLSIGQSRLIGANMAFRRRVFKEAGLGFLDIFDRRGDETSLVVRYLDRFPDRREEWVEDAVVFNESPEDASAWIRQQKLEGRMTARIDGFLRLPKAIVPVTAGILLRILSVPSYVLVPMVCVGVLPVWASTVGIGWLIRHGMRLRHIVQGIRNGAEIKGARGAITAFLLTVAGLATRDVGYLLEISVILFRRRQMRPLEQSVGTIKRVVGPDEGRREEENRLGETNRSLR